MEFITSYTSLKKHLRQKSQINIHLCDGKGFIKFSVKKSGKEKILLVLEKRLNKEYFKMDLTFSNIKSVYRSVLKDYKLYIS